MARTHSATSLANLRPFQPGISGNPGGRPSDRDPVNYALKKTHGGREMFDVLISIALDRGAKKHDRIAAAAIVLDRLFGRAKEHVAAESGRLTVSELTQSPDLLDTHEAKADKPAEPIVETTATDMAEVAVEPKQLDFTHLDAAVDQLDTPEDRDG